MQTTITSAFRQYVSRPADEVYPDPETMIAAAAEDRRLSAERAYNLRELRAVESADGIGIQSPKGIAGLTHWAFGQWARMLGAPASYLRALSPRLAVDCLNEGIDAQPVGDRAVLLARAPNGQPAPMVRSVTRETYGRLWDADYMRSAASLLGRSGFSAPKTWDGKTGGLYRGDRDSFMLLVDGGSIVTDPSAGSDGRMYRGVMMRNSEVGASSFWLDAVLFRYICGNLMIWGAVMDRQYRRRHFGSHVLRDVERAIGKLARDWSTRPASSDEAIIKRLIDLELATTEAGIVDELRKIGATKEQAESAYRACVAYEAASPRSAWGIVQGLTRVSQSADYQSDRFELDQLAARVLARASARVAA